MLEKAQKLLEKSDFGADFDTGLGILDSLVRETKDKGVAHRALHRRALAHLELFLTAVLTGDEAHYEKLKSLLSWQLEGRLMDLRNFQIMAQEIMEEFRLVEREARPAELKDKAAALALFAGGLQGVLFKERKGYHDGRKAVAAFPELAYLDDLMGAWDLVFETLRFRETPEQNWQRIVTGVLSPVCPAAALTYADMICTSALPTAEAQECSLDLAAFGARARENGARHLGRTCKWPAGEAAEAAEAGQAPAVGLAAVQRYYEARFARLAAGDPPLPAPLAGELARLSAQKETAYERLRVFFKEESE
jgi:hypothetical protein